MGQAAYNYDYTEVRRRKPRPQPQRKNNLRVEKGGKRRLTPLQAAMHHMMHLLSLGLLVGFAVALLWSEAQIVELSSEIRSAKATARSMSWVMRMTARPSSAISRNIPRAFRA